MTTRPLNRILHSKILSIPVRPSRCSSLPSYGVPPFKHPSNSSRDLSSRPGGHVLLCSRGLSSRGSDHATTMKSSSWHADQENLFQDPKYFQTPVLMLHCQWTDFAVSLHEPDKLDELDCTWSCFPSDLKIYGSFQRIERKTIQLVMARAKIAMRKFGGRKWRIVFKGYNTKSLNIATDYFDETAEFDFISLTDLSRKLGEESIVYQRAVPRYPVYKKPMDQFMPDGPEWAPTSLLDKFRKLNVMMHDRNYEKGVGLTIRSEDGKATKRGFILKKSDQVDKRSAAGEKSLSDIKHLIER